MLKSFNSKLEFGSIEAFVEKKRERKIESERERKKMYKDNKNPQYNLKEKPWLNLWKNYIFYKLIIFDFSIYTICTIILHWFLMKIFFTILCVSNVYYYWLIFLFFVRIHNLPWKVEEKNMFNFSYIVGTLFLIFVSSSSKDFRS